MTRIRSLPSEGAGMSLSKKRLSNPVSMHLHEYYELEIVLSGTGEQILNGTGYPIGPGSVYFLTPIDFHAITPRSELHIAHLAFEESMLSPQMRLLFMNRRDNYIFPGSSPITQTLQTLFELLLQESSLEDGYSTPCRTGILELMLLTLARAADQVAHPEVFAVTEQMQRSLQYLFCHFREEITLGQVAAQSGYTPTYFSKRFHETRPSEKIVEQFIHKPGNVFKETPSVDKGLVVGGVVGDIKIIPAAAVEFRVHPVQGIGDNGQSVGPEGAFFPGWIDFTGSHIFYIIDKGNGHIGGIGRWRSQMYGDILGDIGNDGRHILPP